MTNTEKEMSAPSRTRARPLASAFLESREQVELIYNPKARQTAFAVWKDGACRIEKSYTLDTGERVVPYSANNNLIRHNVVLLPFGPDDYESEKTLLADIRSYIHRYVDVSERFEKIAAYYVLLTWIYDSFNELPYLRLRGDYGSGKTRFLLTVGALCYMPTYASGASTVSPLFHTLDAFRGTLLMDEADFRFSDEKAEIIKILNNGNIRGMPVLRTEVTRHREYNPRAFTVYGPKIICTRGSYSDRALESRCITEETGQRRLCRDIPLNLPSRYEEEALALRNKLLMFRFRTRAADQLVPDVVDRRIEPRLNQMFAPLMAIVSDSQFQEELRDLARSYHRSIVSDRGMDIEGHLLQVIRHLMHHTTRPSISIRDITATFIQHYAEDYERAISNKWIGGIIRRKLHIETHKSAGNYVIPITEAPKLDVLYDRYGITSEVLEDVPESDDEDVTYHPVDIGGVGDVQRR